MNRQSYLLGKIAEQAAEVAAEALKAQQFGLEDRFQDGPSNAERLAAEVSDLLTVVGMLCGVRFRVDGNYKPGKPWQGG